MKKTKGINSTHSLWWAEFRRVGPQTFVLCACFKTTPFFSLRLLISLLFTRFYTAGFSNSTLTPFPGDTKKEDGQHPEGSAVVAAPPSRGETRLEVKFFVVQQQLLSAPQLSGSSDVSNMSGRAKLPPDMLDKSDRASPLPASGGAERGHTALRAPL